MVVNIITKEEDAPVILSTRFAEWIPGRGAVVDTLALSDWLEAKFGDGEMVEGRWHPFTGDPRAFRGGDEISFVAAMRRTSGSLLVGILTEVELAYVEGEEGDESTEDADGNLVLPPPVFAELVEQYRDKLKELQDAFPHSDFLIAHGSVTYQGRLSLLAFTPLSGQEEMHYSSPYREPGEIEALAKMMMKMTLEYGPISFAKSSEAEVEGERLKIETGVSGDAQESSFANATLLTYDNNISISIATELKIPTEVIAEGLEATEAFVRAVLAKVIGAVEEISFEVQIGPNITEEEF